MKIVSRTDFEFGDQVTIERGRIRGFGVDEESATTDVLRQLQEPGENVLKKSPSTIGPAAWWQPVRGRARRLGR